MTEESAGAGLTRRRLLGSAAAALPVAALPFLLTACKGVQALGTPPPPNHDIVVLRATIAAEELMVATCAAGIVQLQGAGTAGASALAAVRTVQAEHSEHLTQLRSRLIEPTGGPSPHPSPKPTPAALPGGSPADILTALGHAEQTASDRLIGELTGLPPTLAQLFASIAASEATHVQFLQAAAQTP